MQLSQLGQEPEKVFIVCKNVSGATLSAGAAAYFDTASVTDGVGVSGARTGQKFLFAGVNEASLSNSSYGRVQVYGVASAYCVLASSTVSAIAGQQLDAVASQTYLVDYTTIAGSSAPIQNPFNFVTLMETYASAAAASNTPGLKKVFIRAL